MEIPKTASAVVFSETTTGTSYLARTWTSVEQGTSGKQNGPISTCCIKHVANDSPVNNMKTFVLVSEGRHSHTVPRCFSLVD